MTRSHFVEMVDMIFCEVLNHRTSKYYIEEGRGGKKINPGAVILIIYSPLRPRKIFRCLKAVCNEIRWKTDTRDFSVFLHQFAVNFDV